MEIKKEDLLKCIQENPKATIKQLSDILGTTPYYVRKCIAKNGIVRKKQYNRNSKLEETVLREFIDSHPDATQKEIAEALGVTVTVVNRRIKELGIDWEYKIPKNIEKGIIIPKEELEKYFESHKDAHIWEAAIEFNVSEFVLRTNLKRYGMDTSRGNKYSVGTKLNKEEVEEYIKNHEVQYLWQLANYFKVNERKMLKFMKDNNIKLKQSKKINEEMVHASREVIIQKAIMFLKQNPNATIEQTEQFIKEKLKTSIPLREALEEKRQKLLKKGDTSKAIYITSLLNRGKKQNAEEKDER